jgi:hypothetical protein
MLLGAIRQRLRLIRYYSATRSYNRWSRALDIALVVALLAAWPVTWLADRTIITASAPVRITGNLYEEPDGLVWAWRPPPQQPPTGIRGDAAFTGSFSIELRGEEYGWPFVTSRGARRLALNVELFEENRSLGVADLPPESPVRLAIDRVLRETGHERLAGALWAGSAVDLKGRARGWAANGLVWSVGLAVAAWLLVLILRIGYFLVVIRAQKDVQRRRRDDRCVACGYNMQGNPFSERCPECGAEVAN